MIIIIKRKYNLSDAGLIKEADSIKNSAVRDLTDLARFNVTAAMLNQFVIVRNNFSNFLTDEESSGVMMIATEDKNLKRDLVRQGIRDIMVRVGTKYGANSAKARQYGVNALSTLIDNDLARCAYRVLRLATANLTDLASEGLTQVVLNTFTNNADAFDEAIDVQDAAIRQRDIDVDERIRLGNLLYEMVSKISGYGKAAFENTNEAKFNDYVIYHSPNKSVQVFSGSLLPQTIVNLSVTGVTGNEEISIENPGNETIIAYFSAKPVEEPMGLSVSVLGHTILTFQVYQLGFVPESVTRLNLKNASANVNDYLVRVEG